MVPCCIHKASIHVSKMPKAIHCSDQGHHRLVKESMQLCWGGGGGKWCLQPMCVICCRLSGWGSVLMAKAVKGW